MSSIILPLLALLIHSISEASAGDGCCILAPQRSLRDNLTLAERFREYRIVGDYIQKPPTRQLVVKTPPDVTNSCQKGDGITNIQPGDRISPIKSFNHPIIEFPDAVEGTLYALFLLDIDAPSPKHPSARAYIHGIFLNCPYNDLSSGDVVVPYAPATPGLGTGLHRYVGLLYKQHEFIDTDVPELWRLARERIGFFVEEFVQKYNLEGPEAGNFSFGEMNACGMYDD